VESSTSSKLQTRRRPLWSERNGRGPKSKPLSLEELRRLCLSDIDGLWARGYFQQAFGYECVDAGEVNGELINPPAHFYRLTGRDNLWPHDYYGHEYDLDMLIEFVEVLHDLASKPLDGYNHTFSDCGWHYEAFDQPAGKEELRIILNETLKIAEPSLRLQKNGEVTLLHSEELERLLDARVPATASTDSVSKKIDEARWLFRSRNSDLGDRRRAVRELADVLEAIRPEVKAELLRGDERDLFNIANNFAIRHNDPKQKREYEDALWIGYLFQLFLSNIHLVLRLNERPAQNDF
jgi:hypothetical protein